MISGRILRRLDSRSGSFESRKRSAARSLIGEERNWLFLAASTLRCAASSRQVAPCRSAATRPIFVAQAPGGDRPGRRLDDGSGRAGAAAPDMAGPDRTDRTRDAGRRLARRDLPRGSGANGNGPANGDRPSDAFRGRSPQPVRGRHGRLAQQSCRPPPRHRRCGTRVDRDHAENVVRRSVLLDRDRRHARTRRPCDVALVHHGPVAGRRRLGLEHQAPNTAWTL